MTTRACDFSSFKRPPRPPASSSNSSPHSTSTRMDYSNRTTNNRVPEAYSTAPRPLDGMASFQRKYMKSHSVDQNSCGSSRDMSSPTMSSFSPGPITTLSTQNLDKFPSYGQSNVSHSTIDRTTLPYERRKNTPAATPIPSRDSPTGMEHRGSGSGSGLLFVDGGRRGVMSADSQHSLSGSLSGHPIDRSLVHRQNSSNYSGKNSFDGGYDGGYGTHPGLPLYTSDVVLPNNNVTNRSAYSPQYHTAQHPRGANVYLDSAENACDHGGETQSYTLPYNHMGDVAHGIYSNNTADMSDTRHDNVIRTQRSPHNISSGESGIAGCDFNTLGTRSYEPSAEHTGNYSTAVSPNNARYPNNVRGPLASGSLAAIRAAHQMDVQGISYDSQTKNKMPYGSGTQASNGGSHMSSNTAESSLTHRGDVNQQTHLLTTGSDNLLNTSADETSIARFEQSQNISFPLNYPQHQSSVPKISTRSSSRGSYKKGFNPFKKKKTSNKMTNDIYSGNNLYGPNNKKSSKYNSKVVLGGDGGTTTGISFNKYSPKRPFCPRWQCVVLAVAVGVTIFLCLGLFTYLYIWPSILEPLVESSKPIDGQWGSWKPWFQCSATCGEGVQNRTRECNSPSPEDGGKECPGPKYEMRKCNAPIECPDCSRICDVGTLSADCRSCTCEGHVITGRITDEFGSPLSGVKIYKGSGATLLLSGTDNKGEFRFEGVCSNGDNELVLKKEMYRTSKVHPTQSETDPKMGFVAFAMIKLFLPTFTTTPSNEDRLAGQKVILCCEAESQQPPTQYVWYKDGSRLDPIVYLYSLQHPRLILSDLMEWDSGDYVCEAHNEAGIARSVPATLKVYGNWTDLCDPNPADKFIDLPDGCSQGKLNTGTCSKQTFVTASDVTSASPSNAFPQCISPNQYPNDSPNDICYSSDMGDSNLLQYCCKALEEEEITIPCTIKETGTNYNMALKRILSCSCELC